MLCFRKFPVAKKFMDKRGGGGGGKSRFSVEFFCLAVPKNVVGEPFGLSLISGIEKVWMRGWGGGGRFKIFRRNFRVSQCRKNSSGNPLGCH